MKNPLQNSRQTPQPNSHTYVGELFTDFLGRVAILRSSKFSRKDFGAALEFSELSACVQC